MTYDSDLVAFLRARLDEDEHTAQAASGTGAGEEGASWTVACNHIPGFECGDCSCSRVEGPNITIYDEGGHNRSQAHHITRWDPARVLAEVTVKRGFVTAYIEARDSYEWWRARHDPTIPGSERGVAVASASLSEWLVVFHTLAGVYASHPDYPTRVEATADEDNE